MLGHETITWNLETKKKINKPLYKKIPPSMIQDPEFQEMVKEMYGKENVTGKRDKNIQSGMCELRRKP